MHSRRGIYVDKTIFRCWVVLFLLLPVSLVVSISSAWAEDGFVPIYHPRLKVSRAAGPIEIDGYLNDEGWRGAAKADNFAEHNPGDQTKPDVDTEVLITYDDENLYAAWLCYDDPAEVRASLCERDKIFTDDYVILCIDTYGEATLAYEISSNPLGIPGDLLFSSTNNGEDSTYEMIFETAGRVTDFGYVVEMAIPFSSMRFPDREDQVWRVDFWRNRPRESRYQYSWAAYNRSENCWPCQWGTVSGVSGVRPGAGLELLPAVIAYQVGSMSEAGHFENSDPDGDLALGISYDISSELTAEATINPDFSQVEADVAQIDVNSTFALFYEERRPFFQEGSDLFETFFEAVYTRSINDPLVTGKMTWRNGPNSIALLTARDEHSVIILPFEESSEFVENGKSYSNIVRIRHDLGGQSHVGLIATDRRFDSGGSGSLVGLDSRIRLSSSNSISLQVMGTYTDEVDNPDLTDSTVSATLFEGGRYTAGLDGESFYGHGLLAGLNRSTENYWIGAQYHELSPTFRADNGFEPSNNKRQARSWAGGIKRFEDSEILEDMEVNINIGRKWNFDSERKDEWLNVDYEVDFRAGQTGINSSLLLSNELFHGTYFEDIWQFNAGLSTQPSRALAFGGNINYGHRIARQDLVMGEQLSYTLWADIRPIDRLLIETSFNYIKSDDIDTGKRLFSQSVFWSRLSLQLSREFSMRFVTQYNDRFRKWDFDPLLTYRINSLTVFYIGSTIDYRDMNPDDYSREGWGLTDRQYFMKVQYLFQL